MTRLTVGRILVGLALATALLGLADVASHRSVSPTVFGRWSVEVAALLAGMVLAALALAAGEVWLLTGNPERRSRSLDRAALRLAHPLVLWLIGLGSLAFLGVLWNAPTPLWRTLLREVTLWIVLVSGGLLAWGLSARQEGPLHGPSYRPILSTIVAILAFELAVSFFFNTAIPDEGSIAYQAVWLVTRGARPYDPQGIPMVYPPLMYYPLGIALRLIGADFLRVRIISLMGSLAGLAALWVAAYRAGGRWAALVGFGLLALSPPVARALVTAFPVGLSVLWLTGIVWAAASQWPPALRVTAGCVCAALAVLTRNTLAPVLPVVAIYFALTERPRDWLVGELLAVAGAAALVYAAFPDVPHFLRFLGQFLASYYTAPQLGLADHMNAVILAAGSCFTLLLSGLLALWLVIRAIQKHGWQAIRPQLSAYRIPVLAASMMLANALFLLVALPVMPASGNLLYYALYFVPLAIFPIGVALAGLRPMLPAVVFRQPALLYWAAAVLALIGIGPRAPSLWHWRSPPALGEIQQVQRVLAAELDSDDTVVYLAPFHPLVGLPEPHVYPDLTLALYRFRPAALIQPGVNDLWVYSEEDLEQWLSEASAVVIEDSTYRVLLREAAAAGVPDLDRLIQAHLQRDYRQVVERPVQAIGEGNLHIYRRVTRGAEP